MLFDKFKQTIICKHGVNFHFVKTNSKQVICSIATTAGSNYEFLKNTHEKKEYLPGSAHLVEHLLFHNQQENEYLTNTYRKHAIIHNAMTSPQLINFFIKTNQEQFFKIGFEKIVKSIFTFSTNNSWFEKEQNVIADEINNHWESENWNEIKSKYTYNHNIIGNIHDVMNNSLSQCIQYYKDTFKLKNTHIFIVGDFDSHQQQELIQQFEMIKKEIILNYPVNMFNNESDFTEDINLKVKFDQKNYEITDFRVKQQLFTTIIAVNCHDLNLNKKEFKRLFRVYRYLNHFSSLDETLNTTLALQKGLHFEHTGIKLMYFDKTVQTFYIKLIIANIDNQYSKKRITSKLEFLRSIEKNICDNIDEQKLQQFIANKLKIGPQLIEENKVDEIWKEFTYDTLVNNFEIYGFNDIDMRNDMTLKNIEQCRKIDFNNYINLTINNKE